LLYLVDLFPVPLGVPKGIEGGVGALKGHQLQVGAVDAGGVTRDNGLDLVGPPALEVLGRFHSEDLLLRPVDAHGVERPVVQSLEATGAHRDGDVAYLQADCGSHAHDGTLPLTPGKVALYGAGAGHTIKGGTGSGEVNERHSETILEDGDNLEIVSFVGGG